LLPLKENKLNNLCKRKLETVLLKSKKKFFFMEDKNNFLEDNTEEEGKVRKFFLKTITFFFNKKIEEVKSSKLALSEKETISVLAPKSDNLFSFRE